MARQYSHLQFFRRVPNSLLARYFHEKCDGVNGVDFAKLKENQVRPILDALTALPEEQQTKSEAEFKDIDNMACEGGMKALIDEASFHGNDTFPEELSKIESFHGRAMWAFLEYPDYWQGATLFLRSDNISDYFWKKRNDFPQVSANVDEESIERLTEGIREYFRKKEGRGRNCEIEVFRRYEKEYFFAYPEDYAQADVEWVKKELNNRPRNPAFEIIFVYSPSEGSLDIYAPRNSKAVNVLQQIFAETILGLGELDSNSGDDRVYVLDVLADRDFVFRFKRETGIESVAVKRLRLSYKTGNKKRVTIEADPDKNPKAVYDVLDDLKLPPFHVTQVEIKVTFAPTPETKRQTRSFRISYPNWCSLRHDGRDLIIRKMLADSGIEPMKPKTSEDENAA